MLIMQVVTGGHYDVDVILTDPTRNVLYKQIKKQYDSHTWTAAKTGGNPSIIKTTRQSLLPNFRQNNLHINGKHR